MSKNRLRTRAAQYQAVFPSRDREGTGPAQTFFNILLKKSADAVPSDSVDPNRLADVLLRCCRRRRNQKYGHTAE
jgi:hypothetical protein